MEMEEEDDNYYEYDQEEGGEMENEVYERYSGRLSKSHRDKYSQQQRHHKHYNTNEDDDEDETTDAVAIHEGYLYKKTARLGVLNRWHRRYFLLYDDRVMHQHSHPSLYETSSGMDNDEVNPKRRAAKLTFPLSNVMSVSVTSDGLDVLVELQPISEEGKEVGRERGVPHTQRLQLRSESAIEANEWKEEILQQVEIYSKSHACAYKSSSSSSSSTSSFSAPSSPSTSSRNAIDSTPANISFITAKIISDGGKLQKKATSSFTLLYQERYVHIVGDTVKYYKHKGDRLCVGSINLATASGVRMCDTLPTCKAFEITCEGLTYTFVAGKSYKLILICLIYICKLYTYIII